eukprot:1186179-Prorocentrum_minimum.AAC.6
MHRPLPLRPTGEACQHKVLTPDTRALTVIGPEEGNPNGPLAVPHCTPVSRTGLGLIQGTSTLHTELAPGNPGCSRRW